MLDKAALIGKRATTNKRVMPVYRAEEEEPDLFTLGARGHVLPPPTLDDGSDIDDWDSPPPEQPAPGQSIDSLLSNVWRQFIIDITGKSPNPKGITNPSYLLLTDVQRQSATEGLEGGLSTTRSV